MLLLIFAGEIIFSLPFHIPRFFRPTFLEVFQLNNTQLGDIFALYGVIAMLCYFPGGIIADYFPARKLMSLSLICTGLGGFYLHSSPSLYGLYGLFAFWGLTSVLLFWAAMIKATRDLGGPESQGFAFGFLDGGRGLIASIFASIAVLLLTAAVFDDPQSLVGRQKGLNHIVLFYSISTLFAGLLVWWLIPDPDDSQKDSQPMLKENLSSVLLNLNVWLQGGIIITAYCGFKALDNYGVYAVNVLNMTQVESAELTTIGSYARPFAAIAAGLIADKWKSSKLVMVLFALAMAAFMFQSFLSPTSTGSIILLGNLLITFIAVYALRGIYFTMIEEAKLETKVTGTAVGLISVLGYTPDIFFSPITGRILDANPGQAGFEIYFLLLAALSAIGLLFSYILSGRLKQVPN